VPANEVFELKGVLAIEIPVGTSEEVTVGAIVIGAGSGVGVGVGANGSGAGVGAGAGGGFGASAAELSACVVIDPLVFELAEVPIAFVALTVKV
jgi:hypothetical protein